MQKGVGGLSSYMYGIVYWESPKWDKIWFSSSTQMVVNIYGKMENENIPQI